MSIGLAFVQGLVGGFQKNIEREQTLRTADDQRLAGLQDTLFKATAEAAAKGNPVPNQLGDMLRKAKEDVGKRPDIGLFGTGKAERLNLDFTGLASTVNTVGGNYIDYGDIRIPVNENFFKGTGPGSIVSKADLYMKAMDTWLTKGNNRATLKKYMEDNPNSWSKKISGDLYRYGETWSLGTAKTLAPDQKDATLIPQVKKSFGTLGGFLEEVEGILPKDMKQLDMAYNSAEKLMFDEKYNVSEEYTRKDSILLPFLNDKGDLTFSAYKFKNLETLAALKNIAKKNGFENKVGKYIYHFRKETEQALPQLGELKIDIFNKEGMLPEESNIATVFPSLIHAANLEILGGGKTLVNMSSLEQTKVLAYFDQHFTKPDGEIDIAGRVRAMAPLIQVPESEISKFNSKYRTFEKSGATNLKNRNDIFERLLGISVKDFTTKYEANVKSINGIRQLVELRKIIPTSSGLVEQFKQFFGGIVAPSGQYDQLVDLVFGRGDKKDDVSTESLKSIVARVKKNGGIISNLSDVNQAEAIMIVLAADMARAADPSGRLSNQDFEVQLKRLGKTGFFSTKLGQFAALGTVMDDFANRFQRIEMVNAIVNSSSNGILTPRQLQILYANQKVLALQDKISTTNTGGGSGVTYTDEFPSSLFEGSNGETVIIKKGSDGVTYYFINGQQVDKNQIKRKGQTPSQSNNQETQKETLIPEKKQESNQNNLDQTAPEKITGRVVGGDKVNGLKLQGKEGLYLQNKDGTFSKKPSGTGA